MKANNKKKRSHMSQNRIMKAAVFLIDGGAGTRTLCLTRAASSCKQQEWELYVGTELEASCQARPGLCSETDLGPAVGWFQAAFERASHKQ